MSNRPVPEYFQRDLLLGHGHDGLLEHPDVVDAHAAEDGKRLNEVLVVLRERQVLELVDQLEDAQDPVVLAAVLDGHAQDGLVSEPAAGVDGLKGLTRLKRRKIYDTSL